MEICDTDVRVRDRPSNFISVYIKEENDERETEFNDVEIITAAQHFCAIEIKESRDYNVNNGNKQCNLNNKNKDCNTNNEHCARNTNVLTTLNSGLHEISNNEQCNISNVLSDSIYLSTLDAEPINVEVQRQTNQCTEAFIGENEHMQASNYISTVTIPTEFLEGLNLNIKKEATTDQTGIYTAEWLCDSTEDSSIKLKVSKDSKQRVQIPTDIEATITPILKCRGQLQNDSNNINKEETRTCDRPKRRVRLKSTALHDYKEKLRKKAECMREKRKKLYEQESEEQRLQRLAKEAAKRREMRMYYETPEQRRKRLDAEAARKREYRMYNETPEDRRKRLDREAERRRIKRLSVYANETPEQRRERLNRESTKRREARLNQYAKETEEQRKERLRRDALRAREMRFTRSAIETEEERRQRLVKDALRKREVRLHGGHSVNNNFTELQTVRNFEELNNVQIKDNPDNQLGGHYLSNWMMWFQNTLAQPVHIGEQTVESHSQNNG